MSISTDFKSINRILNRMEQKAEFEEKNPLVEPAMYGWPYGVTVPFVGADGCGSTSAGRISGGSCESVTLSVAELPNYTTQTGPNG